MKPQIARAVVLQQASALLGESLADGRAAEFGADHLVVFATAPGCGRVVITVGEDAATDAYVLDQLRDLPVLVPRPLARGTIVANQRSYPVVIMTRAAGLDLATVPDQHRYLPELVAQLHLVHGIVKLSLLGTVGGLKVGNDRRTGGPIQLLQALVTARTGSVWGGFVQSKLNVTIPHGGLAQFGYPLSELRIERLEDGREHEVQYFERGRFELHGNDQILLGQLGRRILAEVDAGR